MQSSARAWVAADVADESVDVRLAGGPVVRPLRAVADLPRAGGPGRRPASHRPSVAVPTRARPATVRSAVEAHPSRPALARAVRGGGCARAAHGPVRLTGRGRRLVALLLLFAAVGVASLAGVLLGTADGLELAGESRVVVESGDTLWSIASSVAGEDDVRAVVDRIQSLNGLHGADLVPGQVLELP